MSKGDGRPEMGKVFNIALATFRELVRGKVLYTTLFFAILVVLTSALFGSVTIGDQVQVVKDFGLFSISLCSAVFVMIAGASLLHKELSRRTVYVILSRPVTRFQFLSGKYLGMLATVSVMIVLMGALLLAFVGLFEEKVEPLLLLAYVYIWAEMAVICAAAIFFSAVVVTPSLSGLFTCGLFLAGRSVEYLLYFIREGEASQLGAKALKALYYLLPHLSQLNARAQAVFAVIQADEANRLVWSLLYSGSYAILLLVAAGWIFSKRDFL